MIKRRAGATITIAVLLTICAAPLSGLGLSAAPSPMQASASARSRVLGTVTAVGSNSLTIKPTSGNPVTVAIGGSTHILRLKPGQKSLSEAKPIQLTDISVGDRVLASAIPGKNNTLTANLVVAMKRSDIAARRRAEQQAWQRNGVGGIVKSVHPAGKTIVLASAGHDITIKVPSSATIRKYAGNSVAYKNTRPSVLDAIKPGDQLRAKGSHSAGNTEVTANAVVFGDFQNIAGLVANVNSAAKTLTVNNLATHKPVTLAVGPSSVLRKLPQHVAQRVAARLHAIKEAKKAPKGQGSASNHSQHRRPGHPGAEHKGSGQKGANGFSRVLDRATPTQLSNLHKGEAVMVVASKASNSQPGTVLTLLSGVAPMLRASRKGSQSLFSSSWSLGGGQSSSSSGGGQQGNSGSQKK